MRAGERHKGRLALAFAVLATFMVVEVVGGAAHRIARPPVRRRPHAHRRARSRHGARGHPARQPRASSHPHRTFGLYRLEILAALANAALLVGVAVYVLVEAIRRIGDSPERARRADARGRRARAHRQPRRLRAAARRARRSRSTSRARTSRCWPTPSGRSASSSARSCSTSPAGRGSTRSSASRSASGSSRGPGGSARRRCASSSRRHRRASTSSAIEADLGSAAPASSTCTTSTSGPSPPTWRRPPAHLMVQHRHRRPRGARPGAVAAHRPLRHQPRHAAGRTGRPRGLHRDRLVAAVSASTRRPARSCVGGEVAGHGEGDVGGLPPERGRWGRRSSCGARRRRGTVPARPWPSRARPARRDRTGRRRRRPRRSGSHDQVLHAPLVVERHDVVGRRRPRCRRARTRRAGRSAAAGGCRPRPWPRAGTRCGSRGRRSAARRPWCRPWNGPAVADREGRPCRSGADETTRSPSVSSTLIGASRTRSTTSSTWSASSPPCRSSGPSRRHTAAPSTVAFASRSVTVDSARSAVPSSVSGSDGVERRRSRAARRPRPVSSVSDDGAVEGDRALRPRAGRAS